MIEITQRPDSTVVCRPSGDLDFPGSLTFRHVIADLLRPKLKLVIDLRDVQVVDAVGLSGLIGTVRRVRSVAGTARIVNANPRVRCLLRSVGPEKLVGLSRVNVASGRGLSSTEIRVGA
jgi:anti-anti-sigma factor